MPALSSHGQPSLHPDHYYHAAQRPLASLIFLLPFVVLYEIGTVMVNTDELTGRIVHVRAWLMLDRLLGHAPYLPGLTVVVVLLAWHFVRRDRFRFDWRLYIAMTAESVALAIPLLMLTLVLSKEPAWAVLATTASTGELVNTWQAELVMAFGAGVYEELLFRLLAIPLLHMVLADVIGLKPLTAGVIAVVCSAFLFASYHFGNRAFELLPFAFFTLAGIYLGAVFAIRGFGIVAGVHAFFDVYYVAIKYGLSGDG